MKAPRIKTRFSTRRRPIRFANLPSRRDRLVGLLFAALTCTCARPLSADECTQLLDHYTTLLARSRDSQVRPEQVEEVVAQARRKASQDPEFSQCTAKVSRRKWTCAMAAPSVDAVEKCLL